METVRGLGESDNLVLEPHNHPSHLDFLELNVTTGNASFALVQTRKPLDAEALRGVCLFLVIFMWCTFHVVVCYSILVWCTSHILVHYVGLGSIPKHNIVNVTIT